MYDLFISYSRKDLDFVNWLIEELSEKGLSIWVDQEGIAPTEKWMQSIYEAIEASDNFIFIISPDSLSSTYCQRELLHAIKHNKRLIPILRRAVMDDDFQVQGDFVNEDNEVILEGFVLIKSIQYIDFRDQKDQTKIFSSLIQSINTNPEWAKQHTRWLQRAREWEKFDYDKGRLLTATEVRAVQEWLDEAEGKVPEPTQLHKDYLYESKSLHRKKRRRTTIISFVGIFTIILIAIFAYKQFIGRKQEEENVLLEQNKVSLLDLADAAIELENDGKHDLALSIIVEAAEHQNPPAEIFNTLKEIAYSPGKSEIFDGNIGKFSPSGEKIYIVQNSQLQIIDTLSLAKSEIDISGKILDVSISENGMIAIASDTQEILVYNQEQYFQQGFMGQPPLMFGNNENLVYFLKDCGATDSCKSIFKVHDLNSGQTYSSQALEGTITDIDLDPSKKLLAIALDTGHIKIWSLESNAQIQSFFYRDGFSHSSSRDEGFGSLEIDLAISFLDENTLLIGANGGFPTAIQAIQDNNIYQRNILSKEIQKVISFHPFEAAVDEISTSQNGNKVLSSADDLLFYWDRESTTPIYTINNFEAYISSISLNNEGSKALYSLENGTVVLFDFVDYSSTNILEIDIGYNYTGTLPFTSDILQEKSEILVGGFGTARSDPSTKRISLITGETINSYEWRDSVWKIIYLSKYEEFIELSGFGLSLIDLETGNLRCTFENGLHLAISPNQDYFYTSTGDIWNIDDCSLISEHNYNGPAVFLDESTILTLIDYEDIEPVTYGLMSSITGESKTVEIWDFTSDKVLSTFETNKSIQRIFSLSPNSNNIIICNGGWIGMFDYMSNSITKEYIGHEGMINSVDISKNGDTLLTGSDDGTVRLWDITTGEEITRWNIDTENEGRYITGVHFGKEDNSIVVVDYVGGINVFNMASSIEEMISWVRENRYISPINCEQRITYNIFPPEYTGSCTP